jgi:hypothetical protein
MKRIAVAAALLMTAALQMMGQALNYNSSKSNTGNFAITCAGPDGKACTAAHVKGVNDWLTTGKRMHKPLAEVKEVTLVSPKDGGLGCTQNSGAVCTAEQQKALADFYKPGAPNSAAPSKKQK